MRKVSIIAVVLSSCSWWACALTAPSTGKAAPIKVDKPVSQPEAASQPIPIDTRPATEVSPVQLGWICKETDQATPYYVIDSGKPGPVVMIIGGVHGRELASSAAADQIRAWSVRRGKLVVLPEANRQGLLQSTRYQPGAATRMRDLNRDFPTKEGETPKGALATAIWELLRSTRPDWLLDLHEGERPAATTQSSVGNSIICSHWPEVKTQAQAMIDVVNKQIDPRSHYVLKVHAAEGSIARAAEALLGARSLIVESAKADQPLFARTRQHRLMVHRFLADRQMNANGPDLMVRPEKGVIAVAVYDDEGAHTTTRIDRRISADRNMNAYRIGSDEIEAGALSQFQVLIVPGGSSTIEGRELGPTGRERIKTFVAEGGGYIGLCAGAYLASHRRKVSLEILNAQVIDTDRGKDTVRVELTKDGKAVFERKEALVDIFYHNGPIWKPLQNDQPPCRVLAVFRTEVANGSKPHVPMAGTPAILCGTYGKGRVLCSSPHPESTDGLDEFFRQMIRWAAQKKNEWSKSE